MDINASTKVGELLKNFPDIKEKLLAMDERFKILDNPLMMGIVGKMDLKGISEKINLPLDDVIAELKNMVGQKEEKKEE
ncbi:MAG: DUF1858 domain-containing protein [Lachnospiraceae bacterium]|nr:DUF1858 domain-containing protein [Lachnospiraceae bacterium]